MNKQLGKAELLAGVEPFGHPVWDKGLKAVPDLIGMCWRESIAVIAAQLLMDSSCACHGAPLPDCESGALSH